MQKKSLALILATLVLTLSVSPVLADSVKQGKFEYDVRASWESQNTLCGKIGPHINIEISKSGTTIANYHVGLKKLSTSSIIIYDSVSKTCKIVDGKGMWNWLKSQFKSVWDKFGPKILKAIAKLGSLPYELFVPIGILPTSWVNSICKSYPTFCGNKLPKSVSV